MSSTETGISLNISIILAYNIFHNKSIKLAHFHNISARPEVQGTADVGAYSPFRSILLVLTHDY